MRAVLCMMTDEELADLRIVLHLAMHGLGTCKGVTCTQTGIEVESGKENVHTVARVENAVAEAVKSRCLAARPALVPSEP